MIENENIVCVSNTTWEGFYTKSTVQLLSLLAKNNKVLFIEYPFTWKDLIFTLFKKGRAPVSRMLGLKNRIAIQQSAFGTKVYQLVLPPLLPVEFIKIESGYSMLLKFNAAVYAHFVKRTLRKLKMDSPVCINAYNAIYGNHLVGKLTEKLHVFYCYDGPDIRRYGQRAVSADRGLAVKADGLIVTSEFLAESMSGLNKNTRVVKNGVDFSMFNQHAKTNLNKNDRKKVGYIGSIDHRFNFEVVEYAIQNLPDYDFEFVGDQMNKSVAQVLSKYLNVKFFPPVKPWEVPDLLRKCDVGLIPYVCTEYTKNIYPLKINEYLSVGVPVVLTDFAHLPEFEGVVSFAKDKESFSDAILAEIKTDSQDKIKRRIEFAEKNSWENRAIQFGTFLEDFLKSKKR
jgi:glycosyltransferase involved in cell wall biosynthesis